MRRKVEVKGHALVSGSMRRAGNRVMHTERLYGRCQCGLKPEVYMSGVKVKEWHRLHKLAEDCGEEGTCGNAVITCRKHLKEFATYWEIEAINTASRLEAVEAKLRAVEALRDEANAALLTAYRALASIHGDAEDCDDCGTIAEAGEDGCRIHTGTRQARLMWEAVEAIEDTLGPCWCGHTRSEHNDCDERICEAKDCTCLCFKLSKLTAMLTLSSKESAT